ncbi:xanthine dehydrogenase accessory protein XdhC [Celerinatantimonas sp. YJH-8]|uniref:xanthine dehydrogenase accessory protein XdhC n=1 Tax=Celerinatantimonas sp. YJH-8 TaxID=3228714 RepID=UPI0038C1FAA7
MQWSDALANLQRQGRAHVLITIVATRGSVPRAIGSKMVVTETECYDSIGGGNLEYQAIAQAKEMLNDGRQNRANSQALHEYPLAASLGQCCGGHVTLWFEQFASSGTTLLVFGAGHVGQALVPITAQLPLQVRWIDNRAEFIRDQHIPGVESIYSDEPGEWIEQAPVGSYVVILTHNHQLDFELCEAALHHPSLGYIGVIGSQTKARRFQYRLKERGFSDAQISQIHSPMGLSQIGGKRPMEVAVSIAGELIAHYQQAALIAYSSAPLARSELQSLAPKEDPADIG